MKKTLSVLCLLAITLLNAQNNIKDISAQQAFERALELRFQNPDSAVALLDFSSKKYLQLNDTLGATYSLLEKAYVFENIARYANSYDALWTALILNDNREDDKLKSIIFVRLGRIYSYNKRVKESYKYLQSSLELQKRRVEKMNLKKSELVPYYYSLAKTSRELEENKVARIYLDSCYLYFSDDVDIKPLAHLEYGGKEYLDFEKAVLLEREDNNEDAIGLMEDVIPYFQENEPTYLVLIYKYLGDMYFNLSDLKKSEELYRKSLNISEEYKSHVDFTPLVYENLTRLYLLKNDYKNAFKSLEKAKELDAKFFDGRSSINQSLLEIKDNYRLEKDRQEKQIQQQYLKQLEQEEEISKLQMIILLGSIFFIIIIGYGYFNYLRTKHRNEKAFIKRNKELEIQKQQVLIDIKNKELASSALQLIEKDEFLKEIKSKVRVGNDKIKIHEINKVLRSISSNNNNNWDEFKHRFISVNKEFYDKIFEKFPNLSQSDQKICALIKLNMSSKDMARLLGISVESVHTSRHRIRKKMNLPRNVNLEDYINSI
ncbi:tetratricopeptide repeat protein [Maribacter spongiicola]|uniref:Tetratricopeptide repeat protein n=1 Tax=Maribacter spongiicola TaxID=1206753 RepID=A0A4R7K7Q6_9FLAO|nr:tetratricopeptide repeat protein [Maribacter spongiicola]TDT47337.1 tetratricopeptide repeat protein [Maribacter spongiicola]